jgi:hypothetical protein
MVAIFLVLGCALEFSIAVPASRAEMFSNCVGNPAISWEPKAAETMGYLLVSDATYAMY